MKRVVILLTAAALSMACSRDKEGIVLDEFAVGEMYDNAATLCEEAICAGSYEEFKSARERLTEYCEAYRTQLGGDVYTEFLEICNEGLTF
ncbi:MAG: hypothetical protein J6K38_05065 [Alistipes sp.]|nr:hypothetical protein [Alistipes sp.]